MNYVRTAYYFFCYKDYCADTRVLLCLTPGSHTY